MPKNLVIVESPAKARTIERYLGADYRVLASYGHVRDLPENPGKGKFGVDVDHDFEPEYVISEDRRKQVADIAKAAKRPDMVYLATDLDREGEAIAWHVAEAAHVPPSKTRRVTFSEITEPAIREAFAHPREIDQNLVDAQQTRRIVDRLVGYTLSPLLSRKVRGGLSAGRVQSVAVRLVVEREREIDGVHGPRVLDDRGDPRDGGRRARSRPSSSGSTARRSTSATTATAERHVDGASRELAPGRHARSATRTQKRSPAPPFTTSTLQQEASRKLGFSPKRTMSVAQRLYEGVDTGGRPGRPHHLHADRLDRDRRRGDGRGPRGHRRALRRAVHDAQGPRLQDQVEGRPGGPRVDPARRASGATRTRWPSTLKPEELRLYRLIWQRALASQMAAKELETTTIELADGPYELRASRDAGRCSTASPGSTPRVATTTPRTTRTRSGRLPALAEGDATDGRRRHARRSTSPSRRRASPRRR